MGLKQSVNFARSGFIRKLIELTILLLLIQIPISQISQLVWERENTKTEAKYEIERRYGIEQKIIGPLLSLDFVVLAKNNKKQDTITENRRIFVAPENLIVNSSANVTNTYKGIFSVPTYTTTIKLEGFFTMKNLKVDFDGQNVKFNRADLVIGLNDMTGLRSNPKGSFGSNSAALEFAPTAIEPIYINALSSEINNFSITDFSNLPFSVELELSGTSILNFTPLGRMNEASISANWSNPSFIGSFPPIEKEIESKSFTAKWRIPYFANYRPSFNAESILDSFNNTFGVEFISQVDTYRMVTRALKYDTTFIILTILVFFILEIVSDIKIHSIQYLFISAALILFHLLLLSLAEHISFFVAFVIATLTVLSLITSYSRVALQRKQSPWLVATVLSFFYTFLYTILQEQDFSLLIGSIGLTFILAGFMYFTREVNWHEVFGEKTAANQEKVLASESSDSNKEL